MATYMIPCLLGLEKLVGDEVKRLGLKNVRVISKFLRSSG